MKGNGARAEEIWGEVKKIPADIIKDNFPVLKVGDVAAASWNGLTKRLNSAERKIHRFVGRAGETITDARAALTPDNDKWDWYKSEAPLPKPTVTNKAANLTNNGGVAGWGNSSANNDWSGANPMEAFRQQVLEEERQAKLEGDRLWAKELERRAQLAKDEECLGVCDEVESDDSQSDYASALAETMGETPVAAVNQNSYQVGVGEFGSETSNSTGKGKNRGRAETDGATRAGEEGKTAIGETTAGNDWPSKNRKDRIDFLLNVSGN